MRSLPKYALLLLLFAFSLPTPAQTPPAAKSADSKASTRSSALEARDFKLASKLLGREMPYRVVTPKNYEANKNERFPVVYLLHGLTGHFDNWTDQSKLKEHAAGYDFVIVTPEGDNGWYTDSATQASEKYESYIVEELIPEIDKNFRTLADRENRVVAGLSMGGYGSLKFGLKYPERFALVGSFSGALGAASWTDKVLGSNWKALTDSIMSVYGAEGSRTRKENDIYQIVRDLTPEKAKSLPFIYLDCGTEDFLIGQNRDFAALLLEKKIPHEFRQLPGRHDWVYWNRQVEEFLELAAARLK